MNEITAKAFAKVTEPRTYTGNRGLEIEEPLIFEIGALETSGIDVEEPEAFESRLGDVERHDAIGLPGLSEPETMRHYVRLSQKNYAIDTGIFPLGSCTMKHNPRLNEKMARLPGFGDIHPLQPQKSVPGAIELMAMLSDWLIKLTGMSAVDLSPKAGAHGELCGMIAIRAALEARGEADQRRVVLVPDSAHGTNPATAALLGFSVRPIAADKDGTVRAAAVREALGEDVAAMMITNPNTCGLFEPEIAEIAAALHEARRLSLLRRRQFQRHRRKSAARRPRRRRDAHQSAQDLLDPAWGRWAGCGAGRVLREPCAICAAAVDPPGGPAASCWSRTRPGRARTSRLAGWSPFMARWACSCAPCPTC